MAGVRKAHVRRTRRGVVPVRMHGYKPGKPTLRVEGPDASTLLKKGANVGSPLRLLVEGHVEEAEAQAKKPKYGPQHSLRLAVDKMKVHEDED